MELVTENDRLAGRAFRNIIDVLFLSSSVIVSILTGGLGVSLKFPEAAFL